MPRRVIDQNIVPDDLLDHARRTDKHGPDCVTCVHEFPFPSHGHQHAHLSDAQDVPFSSNMSIKCDCSDHVPLQMQCFRKAVNGHTRYHVPLRNRER